MKIARTLSISVSEYLYKRRFLRTSPSHRNKLAKPNQHSTFRKYGTESIDISKSNIDFFHPDHLKRLQEAKEILKQEKSIITPSDIVARLSFGFWVLLLAGHYGKNSDALRSATCFHISPAEEKPDRL